MYRDLRLFKTCFPQTSDAEMLSLMIQLGTIGKLFNASGTGTPELCHATSQSASDGWSMLLLLDGLLGRLPGSSLSGWAGGVVVCYHGYYEDQPASCPAIPWPWYWLHDTYTGGDVYFSQEELDVQRYRDKYKKLVGDMVDNFSDLRQDASGVMGRLTSSSSSNHPQQSEAPMHH